MTELGRLCARVASLHRTLAEAHQQIAEAHVKLEEALGASQRTAPAPDEVLRLEAAAELMGETPAVFLRRTEYLKASVRRPGERVHRFSRKALERIMADRVAGNTASR